jgi:heme exporter protein CcmD
MKEFLAMGGYAQFVWPAFGLAAAVLVYNFFAAQRRHRQAISRLAMLAARMDRRSTP